MTKPELDAVDVKAGELVFTARAAGADDAPLVLLLHGFPETSYEWAALLPMLAAAGYRAVAPDMRGYSPGARPLEKAAYALDHLTSDVLAIADELGAHRFHVVGHDWGAAVAWHVAARWPGRLRSLCALSVPHPAAMSAALRGELGGDQAQRSWYIEFFRQEGIAEDTLLADDAAGLRNIWTGLPDDAVADYARVLTDRAALTAALNYYRANDLSSHDDVPAIEVPTLFVWSTDDIALAREGAEATASYVTAPYRFEVLEGVDHWIPEHAPDVLSALLLEHLAAHAD